MKNSDKEGGEKVGELTAVLLESLVSTGATDEGGLEVEVNGGGAR